MKFRVNGLTKDLSLRREVIDAVDAETASKQFYLSHKDCIAISCLNIF